MTGKGFEQARHQYHEILTRLFHRQLLEENRGGTAPFGQPYRLLEREPVLKGNRADGIDLLVQRKPDVLGTTIEGRLHDYEVKSCVNRNVIHPEKAAAKGYFSRIFLDGARDQRRAFFRLRPGEGNIFTLVTLNPEKAAWVLRPYAYNGENGVRSERLGERDRYIALHPSLKGKVEKAIRGLKSYSPGGSRAEGIQHAA